MTRSRSSLLVAAALLLGAACATPALAHGGAYQPPPPPDETPPPPPPPPSKPPPPPEIEVPAGETPPEGRDPSDPPPPRGVGPVTPGDPTGGPSTPPDGTPPTPPETPPETDGPITPPTVRPPIPGSGSGPGRRASGPGPDHWTRWWYPNRSLLVARSARIAANGGAITPTTRVAAGGGELWRAEAQAALAEFLHDDDEDIASAAAIALGKAGDRTQVRPLRDLLLDDRRQRPVREAAALGLGLLEDERDDDLVSDVLMEVAASREDTRLRAVCIYALGLHGDERAMPFLIGAASSDAASWDVPAAAVSALGMLGEDLVRADLEALLRGTRRTRKREQMRRVYAAHALARLGSPESAATLWETARDSDDVVRRASALALGVVGREDDERSVQLLTRLLARDRDRPVQNMAALALGRIGGDSAAQALRYAYRKGDNLHQPFAALSLGLLAGRTGQSDLVAPLVEDLEERANADLRGALSVALGLARSEEAIPILRELVDDRGDPTVRSHAVFALGLIGDHPSNDRIRELLVSSNDPGLRREAAVALGMLGDRAAVADLVALVEDGGSVYLQGSAATALGRIGGAQSVEALVGLLRDESRPGLARGMAAVGLGLLLDRSEGRSLAIVGADLDWYRFTSTVREIVTIL